MSPRFEQLLFGSVDLVVDGRESSGWQVIQQSNGLDEAAANEIVRLIEPELALVSPLSGFPTPEEVRDADRRLLHRTVGGVPVLFHTAPAGPDTTGRPNTMTHVVVDNSDTTVRPLLGADAWRAEWWCTPFGPEQMRQARLPSPTALKSGTSVTADAALELVLRPGADAVLGALADVLAHNSEIIDPDRRQVAVLLVQSSDDAAQWIGALLGATAAEPARTVNWSTLARVNGERDLEKLRSSGLDIAAVPHSDLIVEDWIPDGCVIIDPQRPPVAPPVSPFGRFVAAMAADPGLWLAAHESIQHTVLSQMVGQTGITLAWPAAMAQAMDWADGDGPSLFGALTNDALRADVESVLLQATVPALENALPGMADALRDARDKLGEKVDQRGPAGWRELCRRIGDRVTEERASMLGRRYLSAAVHDPVWLLGGRAAAPPLPETVKVALKHWSEQESGATEVLSLVGAAIATIDSHAALGPATRKELERSTAWGHLASELLDDGLAIGTECLAALLAPLAAHLLAPHVHDSAQTDTHQEQAELVAALPELGHQELARQLEQGLAELAARPAEARSQISQPVLAVPVARALDPSLTTAKRPWLALQIALAGIIAGEQPASGALSALSALVGSPRRSAAGLDLGREADSALERSLLPEDLPALARLESSGVAGAGRWMLIVAMRHPEHEESARYLSARRRSTPRISAVKREKVSPASWEEGAVLLGESASRPFLADAMTPESAWTWAENATAAAAQMRASLSDAHEALGIEQTLQALARSAELRASAALIVLSVAFPSLARRGTRLPLNLTEVAAEASQNPRGLNVEHSASWGETCLRALQELVADAAPVGGTETSRDPELSAVAAAVIDARLRSAPESAVPALIREARTTFRGDAPGWARAQQIVPMLEGCRSSRVERLGDMVKKNLNMLPWQKKEGRDG